MLSSVWSGQAKGMIGKETDSRQSSQWLASEEGPAGAIGSEPIWPIPRPSVMADHAHLPFGEAIQDVAQGGVRLLLARQQGGDRVLNCRGHFGRGRHTNRRYMQLVEIA